MNINGDDLFPNPQFFNNLFSIVLLNINNLINQEENSNNNIQPPNLFLPQLNNINSGEEKKIIKIENIHRHRGRKLKSLENVNKIHGKFSFDNIQRKIQVHFLTFLINFCNDALKSEHKHYHYSFMQKNLLL